MKINEQKLQSINLAGNECEYAFMGISTHIVYP